MKWRTQGEEEGAVLEEEEGRGTKVVVKRGGWKDILRSCRGISTGWKELESSWRCLAHSPHFLPTGTGEGMRRSVDSSPGIVRIPAAAVLPSRILRDCLPLASRPYLCTSSPNPRDPLGSSRSTSFDLC